MMAAPGANDPQGTPPPRERILKAAGELFERYGVRGVGVEAIAEAAATNKMTLYRQFASKDELVAAWLSSVIERRTDLWDRLAHLSCGAGIHGQIEHFIGLLGEAFDYYGARGCALMNALAELPEKDHPARLVLDEYRLETRRRLAAFFRSIGLSRPDEAACEVQMLIDGAKASLENLSSCRSRTLLQSMARTLLGERLNC